MMRISIAALLLLFAMNAQALWNCPASSKASVSSQDLERLSFWNLCTSTDIDEVRSALRGTPLLTTKALQVMDEASQPQKSLMRISSHFYDIATKRWNVVEGVGSVVAAVSFTKGINPDFINADYYILTAHHVASGQNLEIRDFRGRRMPFQRVTHDFKSDLSLIKLDTARMPLLPFPFSVFAVSEESNPLVPVTRSFTNNVIRNAQSLEVFKVTYIEGLQGAMDYGLRSVVPLAAWLTPKHTAGDLDLPLLNRQEGLSLPVSFAKGASGSPVLVSHVSQFGSHYELTGILNTSFVHREASTVTSSTNLRKLFKTAISGQSGQTGEWYLFDGSFIKVSSDQGSEVFLQSGPIGNGIAVDGYGINEDILVAKEQGLKIPEPLNELSLKYQQEKQAQNLAQALSVKLKIFKLKTQRPYQIEVK